MIPEDVVAACTKRVVRGKPSSGRCCLTQPSVGCPGECEVDRQPSPAAAARGEKNSSEITKGRQHPFGAAVCPREN